MTMNLKLANHLVNETLQEADRLQLKPLAVVVLDDGGHQVASARQDGCSKLRVAIAHAKASTVISMGVPSRAVAEIASDRPQFVASLSAIAPEGIIPAAGGIPLTGSNGQIIGAVGVSGDTPDNDEAVALFAANAVVVAAIL
jgi:uncharacterized protein GlcG (DUF336 family)